ncbi:iron ABC transporter permease [Spirochaetales bacterium BR151]|uniref:Iron ABC transporter permease n=2 Tax=Entomospira culicis TaxID=2719989 RepID=A0A968L053_9SPIO|nr:iron ABC transporter permease [Entomospira culicis]NIZ69981.1 iron ABC transporter permease [Entomospira culicis]
MRVSRTGLWVVMALLPIVLGVAVLGFGRMQIAFSDVVGVLWSRVSGNGVSWPSVYEVVIFKIRIPRVLMALLLGGGLAVAGASLQGMFANPLVSSDILGVSAGAGFGAALGIIWWGTGLPTQMMALLGGLLAIFLVALLVGRGTRSIFVLVLAGVIVSALFQALISLMKFIADPEDKLPTITYWLMGSLSSVSYRDLQIALPLMGLSIGILWLLRWRINLLSLPEDELRSLGISVGLLKGLIIVSSTLIVATSVAVAGIIGWVGLVIPHMARMLVGANNQQVIPMSLLLGSSYLLVIDTLARSMSAVEMPISILTALIGAPVFALLLKRSQGAWR